MQWKYLWLQLQSLAKTKNGIYKGYRPGLSIKAFSPLR